jgi:multiple sugar transport system substrate-binding protein
MAFAEAFGPIPSLKTLTASYSKKFPANAPILASLAFGHPDISIAGSTEALTAFNSALTNLATTSPTSILSTAQTNLQQVVTQDMQG